MRTGDSMLLLASDGLSRVPRLRQPDATSIPRVAVINLKHFGELLAGVDQPLGSLWRKYIHCHAPTLLRTDLKNGPKYDEVAAGKGSLWFNLLCSFNLFHLRVSIGQYEVGVVPSDLELGLKLGEGGYGVVHLARHRVSGKLFAVKSFAKHKIRRWHTPRLASAHRAFGIRTPHLASTRHTQM